MMSTVRSPYAFLCVTSIVTILIYLPGLAGPFLFDDRGSIVLNPAVQPESLSIDALRAAWFGNHSGPLGRPISSLSFALNYLAHGLDPVGFKFTNLLLHVISGLVLFVFLAQLLNALARASAPGECRPLDMRWTAAIAASLWLLHPFLVSTVLYAVQRMAILSALFCFAGLATYTHGRLRLINGQAGGTWAIGGVILFTAMAALSKENGVLLPLYCLLCEVFVLKFRASNASSQHLLRLGWGMIVALSTIGLIWALHRYLPGVISGYENRPFSFEERVLSQPRILWSYIGMLVTPALASMTLYHDDYVLSTGWWSPPSTLVAVIAWLAVIGLIGVKFRKASLFAIGTALFLASHLIESSIIALEPMFEHRNYFSAAGITLVVASALTTLTRSKRTAGVSLIIVVLAALASLTAQRSWLFGDNYRLLRHALVHHEHSVRTQLWAGDSLVLMAQRISENQAELARQQARTHYLRATELDPSETIGFFEIIRLNNEDGMDTDPWVIQELTRRLAYEPVNAGTVSAATAFANAVSNRDTGASSKDAAHYLSVLNANSTLSREARSAVQRSLGQLMWSQGEYKSAVDHFKRATVLKPDRAHLWISLAYAQMKLGQYDDSRASLQEALRQDNGEFRPGIERLSVDLERAAEAY